jgi:C_GCAxxG_C_C family probable redox protein
MNIIFIDKVREDADKYFSEGFYCSEAVIAAVRDNLGKSIPAELIAVGSGFPTGIGGARCLCGALAGGVIVIGYLFGRSSPREDKKVDRAMGLSKILHDYFISKYQVTCCRRQTRDKELGSPEQIAYCQGITGEIAWKTAEIIAQVQRIEIVYSDDAK